MLFRSPIADATSVSVFSQPAALFDIEKAVSSEVNTSEYSITSKASSIHPSDAASSVLRCAWVVRLQAKAGVETVTCCVCGSLVPIGN